MVQRSGIGKDFEQVAEGTVGDIEYEESEAGTVEHRFGGTGSTHPQIE